MPGSRTRPAARLPVLPLLAALLACLGGCSGVDSLGTAGPQLTDAERTDVRTQVDRALADKRYNLAWNQEAKAGADRSRLEAIALAALRDHSRHAGPMYAELRARHGGLSGEARAEVATEVEAASQAGRWQRAVEIEILTADDAPDFRRAWAVYRAAPPDVGSELLAAILAAKEAHGESGD